MPRRRYRMSGSFPICGNRRESRPEVRRLLRFSRCTVVSYISIRASHQLPFTLLPSTPLTSTPATFFPAPAVPVPFVPVPGNPFSMIPRWPVVPWSLRFRFWGTTCTRICLPCLVTRHWLVAIRAYLHPTARALQQKSRFPLALRAMCTTIQHIPPAAVVTG